MRETEFIDRNKDKWARYEASLSRNDQDPELLHQLYVHTTDDLSASRTFYPNRSVRVYLNGLAQRTFLQIYRGRRGEVGKLVSFWTEELPRAVYASRCPLFVALLLFLISMLIGVLSYRIDPVFAETILGKSYVDMTKANIAEGDPMAVYKSMDAFGMSLHITLNNLLVAFLTFLAGATFCVGTVVYLIRNGVMLGVFQYFFFAQGTYSALEVSPAISSVLRGLSYGLTAGGGGLERILASVIYLGTGEGLFRESLLTIWIHGALEISSIVIAGGAGLTMGSGLLFPGTLTRLQSFGRSARRGLKIMLGTVPLFIVAGFLEGYVTRHTELPDALRFALILLSFGFIVWYYVIYPRVVAARPAPVEATRRPTATSTTALPYTAIRSLGEQLTVTFVLIRRSLSRLLLGTVAIALGYCFLSFLFGGPAAALRYQFESYPLGGDVANGYELLASFGRGRALSFLLLVALTCYGLLRLGMQVVVRGTDLRLPGSSRGREVRLLGCSVLLALCTAFNPTVSALLVFLCYPLLLTAAIGGYLLDLPLRQAFRWTYTHLGGSYGLVALVLAVALPLMYLIDSTLGDYFFTFLDWVIFTDERTIDTYNVILQAFCYSVFLAWVWCVWTIGLALWLGSLREVTTAGQLQDRIASLGRKRRLRGLERE